LVALGLPVLATITLPYTFTPGTPIKSGEVNANFQALAEGINRLDQSKQNTITGSPCGAGQFVRGIAANGAIDCGVDQIGAGGSAGVASLNGLTGSLAIEAGANVSVNTSDGKITVSATGGGGGLSLPFSGQADSRDAAFAVTNSHTAISGTSANANAAGVFGLSSGGIGVLGTSSSNVGVYGEITSTSAGVHSVGVDGRNRGVGGYGVRGIHEGSGFGVYGSGATGTGVGGESLHGIGVLGRGPTAMRAEGHAVQTLGSGGWAKAMVIINPDGTIARCYNGVTGAATGNCGFSSQRYSVGAYVVNFGFDISNRFYSVTALPTIEHVFSALVVGGTSATELAVVTRRGTGDTPGDGRVSIIIY
jgi:hypothetical protein